MNMAQKANLNAWSSNEKYAILKDASDLQFDANSQDLSSSEVLRRTNNYQRLLGATDDQIVQINSAYAQAGITKVGHVEVNLQGAISDPMQSGVEAGLDNRPGAFLGSRSVDSAVVGIGNVLERFSGYVDSNPIAKYALEGLDIASGPAIYAVRKLTPVGDLATAAIGKISDVFAGGFQQAGRSLEDSQAGGVGGASILVMGATGFGGLTKGVDGLIASFRTAKASSKVLGEALEAAGALRPVESAAHHVVAGGAEAAAPARAVLKRFDIGINDAENGVFLPANLSSQNPAGSAVHSTLHTTDYYQTVNEMLSQAASRQDALEVLRTLQKNLLNGGHK